jgi:hypothetical protein
VDGTLHWSLVDVGPAEPASGLDPNELRIVGRASSVRAEGYLAATIVRADLVAGVSRSHIDWLHTGDRGFVRRSTTRVNLRSAVACFPSPQTRELLVVCRDGVVVRVPMPG